MSEVSIITFKLQDLTVRVFDFGHSARVVWNGYGMDFKTVYEAIAFVESRGGEIVMDLWE